MATKQATPPKVDDKITESVEKVSKTVENALERLVESQTRLAEAVVIGRDRSRRVSDATVKSIADSQRCALELTRQIASAPTAYTANIEAFLESATAAQARAMDIAKIFYTEQADAASDLQKFVAPLFASSKGFDYLTKGFQAFMPKSA